MLGPSSTGVRALLSLSLLLLVALSYCAAVKNILDFGAVPDANGTDFVACLSNGKALYNAVMAAHADPEDRVAFVPAGNFSFLPFGVFDGLNNITLVLDGTINLWEGNTSQWTKVPPEYYYKKSGHLMNAVTFFNSTFITLTSSSRTGGMVLGNGWRWWVEYVLQPSMDRPMVLLMVRCNYTLVEGWGVRNSPFANLFFDTMYHAVFQNINIQADWEGQRKLLKAHNKLGADGLPFFPINTGGIQVSGVNITSRQNYIEMFDDAYAVKAMTLAQGCSRDMIFEDTTIVQGVGASVGAIGPSHAVNCIRNITFRRINFKYPIKAIYVKYQPCYDPSTDGTGFIEDVTYEDIYADTPTTWGIYVGTQQQDEGKVNTGCSFLYPLPGAKCPTYPCVSVNRLRLRNVHMENALLSPGMLRCNAANPCTGWEWENVTLTSRTNEPFGNNFLCEAIQDPKFINVTQSCVAAPNATDAAGAVDAL